MTIDGDKVGVEELFKASAMPALDLKNGCGKGETWVDGNCTFEMSSLVQLNKSKNSNDISNAWTEVSPDVWYEVNRMINPHPLARTGEAPKSEYEPYTPAGTGAKEKASPNPTPEEVEKKIKEKKAVVEPSKEENDAKKSAQPVKKAAPEDEAGDLEPKTVDDGPKEELATQVFYDRANSLWRY